jgi:proline iminopeptidase
MPLFPEIAADRSLSWSRLHELHVVEVVPVDGMPVVFLHGGPGDGCSPMHRRFFDPAAFRVVLFDQRGCGRSTPNGELAENTTWDLVADIEKLREHLGIESWIVFGGSWGSTLALAYAESHPSRVRGLILRGIFLSRPDEITWTFGKGLERIAPDRYADFLAPLTAEERRDPLSAYRARLERRPRRRPRGGAHLEPLGGAGLLPRARSVRGEDDVPAEITLARIECHYFWNAGFFEDDQLLRNVSKVAHLPCDIVQGRYDMVCPASAAWDLHQAWPGSRLTIVPDAGHAASEPGITEALVAATEAWKERRT